MYNINSHKYHFQEKAGIYVKNEKKTPKKKHNFFLEKSEFNAFLASCITLFVYLLVTFALNVKKLNCLSSLRSLLKHHF